jgi:hypothetical protein
MKAPGKTAKQAPSVRAGSAVMEHSPRNNIGLETSMVVAQQLIVHSAAQPSDIVLPVIPSR